MTPTQTMHLFLVGILTGKVPLHHFSIKMILQKMGGIKNNPCYIDTKKSIHFLQDVSCFFFKNNASDPTNLSGFSMTFTTKNCLIRHFWGFVKRFPFTNQETS